MMQANRPKHQESKHITVINPDTISEYTKMNQSKFKSSNSQVHLQLGQILMKSLVDKGSEHFSHQWTVLPHVLFSSLNLHLEFLVSMFDSVFYFLELTAILWP